MKTRREFLHFVSNSIISLVKQANSIYLSSKGENVFTTIRRRVYGWKVMPKKITVYTYIAYIFDSLDLINASFDIDDRQFENKTFGCFGKTPSQPRHWQKACQKHLYINYLDASRVVVINVKFFNI